MLSSLIIIIIEYFINFDNYDAADFLGDFQDILAFFCDTSKLDIFSHLSNYHQTFYAKNNFTITHNASYHKTFEAFKTKWALKSTHIKQKKKLRMNSKREFFRPLKHFSFQDEFLRLKFQQLLFPINVFSPISELPHMCAHKMCSHFSLYFCLQKCFRRLFSKLLSIGRFLFLAIFVCLEKLQFKFLVQFIRQKCKQNCCVFIHVC